MISSRKVVLYVLVLLCDALFSQDTFMLNDSTVVNKQFSDSSTDSLEIEIQKLINEHNYAGAISPLIRSIEIYSDLQDVDKVHFQRFLLAKLYFILGWYQRAVNNLEYCQVFYRQNNRIIDYVRTVHLLAHSYYKLGSHDMANYFLNQCESEKPHNNDPICLNEHKLLVGIVDKSLSFKERKTKLSQVLKFAKNTNSIEMEYQAYFYLGELYFENQEYNQACIAYFKSREACDKFKYMEDLKEISFRLYQCQKEQGFYEEASESLLQYAFLSDTLSIIKSNEQLYKTISRYENKELREEKLDLAKNKRLFELKSRRSNFALYSLIISLAAILVAAYFVILFYQQKLETNNIIHKQNEQINGQRIKELENNVKMQSMQFMISGQENERERIAKDLHDSLGGLLSTIKIRFDKLHHEHNQDSDNKDYIKIHELVDIACNEVRSISHDLKPGALQELGIVEAIRDLLNRYNREKGPDIIYQTYGFETPVDIDSVISLQIYRIIQELLNNASKHSQAKEILVQLSLKENDLEIIIEDDGLGFEMSKIKKGSGLNNIYSRIQYLKADINIDSDPIKGTSVLIHVPGPLTRVNTDF
ncbi:MAG: sensor histidine kinase [Bacteroidota bacterium]|nr:sensor histidine kinase [Bacteroidota bacterium]